MRLKITFAILTMLLLNSCSTEVKLVDHIDINKPLNLSRQENRLQTETIDIKSEKYSKFLTWAKKNTSEWQSSPATYVSKTTVSQGDFRLIYNTDYVVISFIDNKGKSKQLTKSVKPNELDFLLN